MKLHENGAAISELGAVAAISEPNVDSPLLPSWDFSDFLRWPLPVVYDYWGSFFPRRPPNNVGQDGQGMVSKPAEVPLDGT